MGTKDKIFGLNQKELLVATAFLENGNQVESYEMGYGTKSKPGVVKAAASRFFQKPAVVAYLRDRRQAVSERTEVTLEAVMNEFATLAFTDTSGLAFKPLEEWTPEERRCVKIVNVMGATAKIEVHDKAQALKVLALRLGAFEQKKPDQQRPVVFNVNF